MNTRRFYILLAKLKKKGWVAKVNEEEWVRLCPYRGEGGLFRYSPMTAVCEAFRGRNFHFLEDREAGKFLGLSERAVNAIHNASFNKSPFGRKALLKRLGLYTPPWTNKQVARFKKKYKWARNLHKKIKRGVPLS
jgi:hypothetical protein